jgi:hypothetical protein
VTHGLRRHAREPIASAAKRVTEVLEQAGITVDRNVAIALFVLGVEHLEADHTPDRLRKFLDDVLAQPVALDPRADTRGT